MSVLVVVEALYNYAVSLKWFIVIQLVLLYKACVYKVVCLL